MYVTVLFILLWILMKIPITRQFLCAALLMGFAAPHLSASNRVAAFVTHHNLFTRKNTALLVVGAGVGIYAAYYWRKARQHKTGYATILDPQTGKQKSDIAYEKREFISNAIQTHLGRLEQGLLTSYRSVDTLSTLPFFMFTYAKKNGEDTLTRKDKSIALQASETNAVPAARIRAMIGSSCNNTSRIIKVDFTWIWDNEGTIKHTWLSHDSSSTSKLVSDTTFQDISFELQRFTPTRLHFQTFAIITEATQ
jgi:hypothetical protein